MARNPSRAQTARPRPRLSTPNDDDDSQSDNSPPVKRQPKTHIKPIVKARTKLKTTTYGKEGSDAKEYTPEKKRGAGRGNKLVAGKIKQDQKGESRSGLKRKNGRRANVSVDPLVSDLSEGEDEDQEERSQTENGEDDSDEESGSERGGRVRKIFKTAVKGGKEKTVSRKGKEDQEHEGSTVVIDGKKLSVHQVRAMMALLCKDHPAKLLGKGGSGIVDEDGVVEDILEEIDFEVENKETEYGEIAIELEEKLQDHFAAVNEDDSELLNDGAADGIGMRAAGCLEARLGSDLAAKYHEWIEAERAFKAASRAHWDEMMKPMEAIRDKMLTVVGQIEKVATSRTQIIQAARRTYDEKVAEHQEEVGTLKAELDRLQKKAAKAYDRYTDEISINNDISMRVNAALRAGQEKPVKSSRRASSKKANMSDIGTSVSGEEDVEGEDEEVEEED